MDQKRIYVSAFEVKRDLPIRSDREYKILTSQDASLFRNWNPLVDPASASRLLPSRGLELVHALRAASLQIAWYLDYWEYSHIEQDIARSNALLAVVDTYYFSSTGKAIELSYATGQLGSGANPPIKPIPVFVFPIDEAYRRYRHLEHLGKWTILETEVSTAVAQILASLGQDIICQE